MSKANITIEERKVIENFLSQRKSVQEIADFLSRHRTSIKREIERNTPGSCSYSACYAQIQYENRKSAPRIKPVTENKEIHAFISRNIKEYSPDVISGRALKEKHPIRISTESIYAIIYRDGKEGGNLWKHLYSQKKKRRTRRLTTQETRGTLKNQRSIHDRPKGADNRSRNGHFEGDTIVGKNNKSMIFTAIDRKNKTVFVHKLKERNSYGVFEAVKLMKEYYGDKFRTLTLDNGKEFACHEDITEDLNIEVFFAEPGNPQQRGSNENFNRMLRRYFQKGIDFRNVPWQEIRSVMNKFNNTPRKSLNYKTPFEVAGKRKFCAMLI